MKDVCRARCCLRPSYGAFLMDDAPHAFACVRALAAALAAVNDERAAAAAEGPRGAPPPAARVACLCKVRCFADVAATRAWAAGLVDAGAELLTVHGRTRAQGGGRRTSRWLADWTWIAAVRERASKLDGAYILEPPTPSGVVLSSSIDQFRLNCVDLCVSRRPVRRHRRAAGRLIPTQRPQESHAPSRLLSHRHQRQ